MNSSDSSSDDDCIYTSAAMRLKAMNAQIQCKTRIENTVERNNEKVTEVNNEESHLQNQAVETCRQVETEVVEIVNSPLPVQENLEEKIEVSSTDVSDSDSAVTYVDDILDDCASPRRITRSNSSKRKTPRTTWNSNKKTVNSAGLEAVVDLNDSIEQELNELNNDCSLNLSQGNDSFVLIGSPLAKKNNVEDDYEISIKVLWKSNEMKRFEIRRNETFQKIFLHFAEVEGVSENQIIISRKDKRINRFDTPASINSRITDIYEGGVVSAEMMKKLRENPAQDQASENTCKIKVQTSDKRTLVVSIKLDVPLTTLAESCAAQLGIPFENMKFFFDGEQVDTSETPESLDIEDEACFDLKIVK